MEILLERLLSRNRWALQVIQDSLSLHGYVPLRIWDWRLTKHVEEILPYQGPGEFICRLHNGAGFSSMALATERLYADRRNSLWLTQLSNSHPLSAYLRGYRRWRAWENYAIGNWLLQYKKKLTSTTEDDFQNSDLKIKSSYKQSSYFQPNMRIMCYPLVNERGLLGDMFLLMGPLFIVPQDNRIHGRYASLDHESEFRSEVETFAGEALNLFSVAQIADSPTESELTLRGGKRGWIRQQCFEHKIALFGNILNAIFTTKCNLDLASVIRNTAYNSLARTVLMLFRDVYPGELKGACAPTFSEVSFEVDHRKDHWLRLLCLRRRRGWELELKRGVGGEAQVIIHKRNTRHEKSKARDEETLKWRREDIGLAFANHVHGYAARKQTVLWRWMNERFLLISTDNTNSPTMKTDYASNPYESLLRRLAAKILDMCTADMVTIFYYNPSDDILQAQATHFQRIYTHWKRVFWRKIETRLMKDAAKDTSLRACSIAYAVVDGETWDNSRTEKRASTMNGTHQTTPKSLFCRAWDENGRSDPPKGTVLNPNVRDAVVKECREETIVEGASDKKNKPLRETDLRTAFTRRAAIAAPLMVHGRLFGILEVDGFSEHQFRFDTLYLTEQMASIVGPFLHHREMLRKLYGLSQLLSDPSTSEEAKYEEICKAGAEIFLAKASLLLVPTFLGSNQFDAVASYKLGIPRSNLPYTFHPEDPLVVGEEVLYPRREEVESEKGDEEEEQGRPSFVAYRYGIARKTIENKDWSNQPHLHHRRALAGRFPNGWAIIIYVFDPSTRVLLLRLSLYYDDQRAIADREWGPYVEFVAHYLADLVLAMRGLRPWFEGIHAVAKSTEVGNQSTAEDDLRCLKSLQSHLEQSHGSSPIFGGTTADSIKEQVDQLHEKYERGQLIVVLGAGVSQPYQIPGWSDLLTRLMISMFDDMITLANGGPNGPGVPSLLAKLFEHFTENRSATAAGRLIKQHFRGRDVDFNEIVRMALYQSYADDKEDEACLKQLASLCDRTQWPRRLASIITYNYDNILEKALSSNCLVAPVYQEEYRVPGPEQFPLFYVHGSLPLERNMRQDSPLTLTEEIYHRMYSDAHRWNNAVQHWEFMNKTCLFIGCSFTDPNLRRLMDLACENCRKNERPNHVAIKRVPKRRKLETAAYALAAGLVRTHKKSPKGSEHNSILRSNIVAEIVQTAVNIVSAQEELELKSFGVKTMWLKNFDKLGQVISAIRDGSHTLDFDDM